MLKCQKCSREVFLPFRCPHCGNYFCPEHRLPENHECPRLEGAFTRRNEEEETVTIQKRLLHEHTLTYDFLKPKGTLHFSNREIKHLTLGAIMVAAVAVSYVNLLNVFTGLSGTENLALTTISVATLVASFFAHEIAHKAIAQKQRLWAEFRLNLLGSILTLISALPLVFFRMISPGAVMVAGYPTTEEMGKVSIAGPVVNIGLSTFFLAGSVFLAGAIPSKYADVLAFGASFNAWIAVFNLVPFGILDGFKIFVWNKKLWVLAFTPSVVLLIFSLR